MVEKRERPRRSGTPSESETGRYNKTKRSSGAHAHKVLAPYIESGPDDEGEFNAWCPLHDDELRSARINFKKRVWYCNAGCEEIPLDELSRRVGQRREHIAL